jgi:branched-chain amino acid transport system substrate-binding protein
MRKVLLALVVLVVVAAAGWYMLRPAQQGNEIVIAVAGPMTGQYSTFGEQMRRGAEQAVKDINAAGGILGKQVRLEVADDACEPKQAVAVANDLANKGVTFVAGHYCSGSSIPASVVYQEEGILQISPASTNPLFTDRGLSNIFRLCGRDDQQGKVAGNFLADKFADKKIAIVHDKQAYSKGLAEETKKQLNARGLKEVVFDTINPGERDYSPLVTKLKAAGVEVLYYGGYHAEAGLIIRQMREQGMDTRLIGGDALVTQELWSITGKAGEGTMMTFGPDPRKNPGVADLVETFRKQGWEPEGYTLYTYAAVQVYKQAVEQAGTTQTAKVVPVLKSKTFTTVMGDASFDAKGDNKAPGYVFYEWHDGKYDYTAM